MVKELEVKVLDIDIDNIQALILSKGGKLIGKERQINTLIDSTEKPIKSFMDAYLRIRENHDLLSDNRSVTLTLKKNLPNNSLRENEEYNVLVDDRYTMLQILKQLGFDKAVIGYKDRTSYSFLEGRIDIDVWDEETYPDPYMEIEVQEKRDLDTILKELEIPQEKVSKLSIVELQQKLIKRRDDSNVK
ncbi:class IV adenylate cyclase [Gudongella sp. SC589]|jgi:adenylate cyclase class 2|uniref:class IV adenylate cyclase n=1 Tax=Gudongella sp. SC589 TaxID=3385990 RepID=UPI00390496BC